MIFTEDAIELHGWPEEFMCACCGKPTFVAGTCEDCRWEECDWAEADRQFERRTDV